MAEEYSQLRCCKCDLPLRPIETNFKYMGLGFHAELPRCPRCGQVYVSEKLLRERIQDVERELEDK